MLPSCSSLTTLYLCNNGEQTSFTFHIDPLLVGANKMLYKIIFIGEFLVNLIIILRRRPTLCVVDWNLIADK